jgi:hypothetical protein
MHNLKCAENILQKNINANILFKKIKGFQYFSSLNRIEVIPDKRVSGFFGQVENNTWEDW